MLLDKTREDHNTTLVILHCKLQDVEFYYCERALMVLPKRHCFRRNIMLLTHTRIFEIVVLLAIVVNCITLALDSNAPDFITSDLGKQLRLADYVFTVSALDCQDVIAFVRLLLRYQSTNHHLH
jgi:hypothetical protein